MRIAFALGAGLLVLALVVRAPATLVDGRLDAFSGGRLRLADTTGTVWDGSGDLRLLPRNAGMRIAWRIDAWPLLWGEVRGALTTDDDASPRASFVVGHGDFTLRKVALALPADALLRAAGAPPTLATAGGIVSMHIDTLSKQHNSFDGRIDLRWDGASLAGPGPGVRIGLGDVRLDGAGQGNELTGTLANVGGDVEISGTVVLAANGTARVDALVRARPGIDADRRNVVAAVLGAVGQPADAGGYRLVWPQPAR